jgi:hypothetical protein
MKFVMAGTKEAQWGGTVIRIVIMAGDTRLYIRKMQSLECNNDQLSFE